MKPAAIFVIGCTLAGGCVHKSLLPPGTVRAGTPLESDILAGYRQYQAPLAAFGTWSPDPSYEFLWCPSVVDSATFIPYRSNGHWVADSDPSARPSWAPDDDALWKQITMHHGWWVYFETFEAPSRWCWVPGAEPSPGRVVWRSGDGFVGWAPMPPPTDDDDEADDDDLEWVFEFEGTLLEDVIEANVLTDEAADGASIATQRNVKSPTRGAVTASRNTLRTFVLAHPDVPPETSEAPKVPLATERPLPSGMALYGRLSRSSSSSSEETPKLLPKIPSSARLPLAEAPEHRGGLVAEHSFPSAGGAPAPLPAHGGHHGLPHSFSAQSSAGSPGASHASSFHAASSSKGGGGGCNGTTHDAHTGGTRK